MRKNNPTQSQLKWQKFAGYVLPILWGWFLFGWTLLLTIWASNTEFYSRTDWVYLPIGVCWLAFLPLSGQSMGILNTYCWRNRSPDNVKPYESWVVVALFWYLPFLLTFSTAYLEISIFLFPLHWLCFWGGQERGKRWIKGDVINRFLGKKSEWEQEKSE